MESCLAFKLSKLGRQVKEKGKSDKFPHDTIFKALKHIPIFLASLFHPHTLLFRQFGTRIFSCGGKKMSSVGFLQRFSGAFRENQSHLKLVLLCTAVRYTMILFNFFIHLVFRYYFFVMDWKQNCHLSSSVICCKRACFILFFSLQRISHFPLVLWKEKARSVHCSKYETFFSILKWQKH